MSQVWAGAVMAAATLAATALPALPQTGVLSAEAFRAWAEGQVIRTEHAGDGTLFGHEEFRPDGTVIWQYPDGKCLTGRWQRVAAAICYHYDGVPEPNCLRYRGWKGGLLGEAWLPERGEADANQGQVWLQKTDLPPLNCGPAPVG
jgi:hypothetical protein